jgi:predicted O-methyltransferase YrrM
MTLSPSAGKVFENLVWKSDRVLLGDLVFRLEHYKNESWELGENCFHFFKTKRLVDQYERFWRIRRDFKPRNVLELGIWDGGSVAFWFEHFQPDKHVALDIKAREDSAYFQRYLSARGLQQKIRTFWKTDQANSSRLREIATEEFDGPLDLVFDDASHLYEPTRASFETLFPLVRTGGLYVIEDWGWPYWPDYQRADHPFFGKKKGLDKLIFQLMEVTPSTPGLIETLSVFSGFVVVERGPMVLEPSAFELERHITRRSLPKLKQMFRNLAE